MGELQFLAPTGSAGWSRPESFTNWLRAFYAFPRTRADEGGYAFLAGAIVKTGGCSKSGEYYLKRNGGAKAEVALGRSPVKNALGHYLRRNGRPVDEPHLVTGYIAWLQSVATLSATLNAPKADACRGARSLDDECRAGVTVLRHAVRGGPGRSSLPAVLDLLRACPRQAGERRRTTAWMMRRDRHPRRESRSSIAHRGMRRV